MSRKLLILVLAFSAILLFSSVAMAAPRVDPSGMTIDAGVKVNWAAVGAVADLNMPLKDSPVSFRAVAEAGFWYWGGFDIGVTGLVMYPVMQEKEFQVGIFGGLQAGFNAYYPFLGITLGVAVEVPVNPQLTLMFEGMYAPAYEFGYGFGWNHGGYGVYGVYELNDDYTLNFGIRSIGLLPGFTVGLTF